jgi:hypothetical protein
MRSTTSNTPAGKNYKIPLKIRKDKPNETTENSKMTKQQKIANSRNKKIKNRTKTVFYFLFALASRSIPAAEFLKINKKLKPILG